MDSSFDLPREPRLSNSILKNRPMPAARTKMKQRKTTPLAVGPDDAVPLDRKFMLQSFQSSICVFLLDSDQPFESTVVFREKKPFPSFSRNKVLPYLSEQSQSSHSVNPSDSTLFYVTSSIADDNTKSRSSSQEPSLSVNHFLRAIFLSRGKQIYV